jgi:hypothetical protein
MTYEEIVQAILELQEVKPYGLTLDEEDQLRRLQERSRQLRHR